MNNELNLAENARTDWFNIVNRHKKKQKGLPALSTLNTNAGNVEKNIEIFNHMQPDGAPSVDAVNGSVECAVCETFDVDATARRMNDEHVTLTYEFKVPDSDNRLHDVTEEYSISKQDIIEYLQDLPEVIDYLHADDLDDTEYYNALVTKFDVLFEELKDQILDHFEDAAFADAEENYEEDPFEYYRESTERTYEDMDDRFDMSTRTLL